MRRIVVLKADGSEVVLPKLPDLSEMQNIVGGYIERVVVMRPQGGYTLMIVNEDGLNRRLPRNEAATVHYQRNVREHYPGPHPFRDHRRVLAARYDSVAISTTPQWAQDAGYDDDPWVCGDVIYFEDYTSEEVDREFEAERVKRENSKILDGARLSLLGALEYEGAAEHISIVVKAVYLPKTTEGVSLLKGLKLI